MREEGRLFNINGTYFTLSLFKYFPFDSVIVLLDLILAESKIDLTRIIEALTIVASTGVLKGIF